MQNTTKVRVSVILGLLLVFGFLAWVKVSQFKSMIAAGKAYVPPPETITATKVESSDWQGTQGAVASLIAVHGVVVGAELPGIIREIGFDSGISVKRGAMLVKLDTSSEEAQLASALADASLANVNLERAKTLRKSESNTQADLDAADAHAKQAEAAVQNLRATIAKKTIRAPFDGRIAMRQVELGQSVSPGTQLASLQSVDPIYAEFTLPQQALASLKLGEQVSMRTDIYGDSRWNGKVSAINPEIDIATRSVRARATFANADGRLKPGMFANVDVISADKRKVLLIPSPSVLYAPFGDSVFSIEKSSDGAKPGLVAKQKFIRVGERRGDMVEVVSGLTVNEEIASSGVFKLKNGVGVVINNDLAPKAEISPTPSEK